MAPVNNALNGVPSQRALASKEAGLFKQLLSQYETRQHKKALKTADQILKKYPEHGETLCMKGLILTQTGKKDEGLELAKKGARFDLTSHIVWHVLGLIHKADKNYDEAHRSYMQALKFEKDSINILRDAAALEIQLRLFDALQETRWAILRLRPNVRGNWIGLALACHLGGNHAEARKVLEVYETTVKNIPQNDFEHSEILLFHVRVIEEAGDTAAALAKLESHANDGHIVDRVATMEYRARLLTKLGREDAEDAWRALIAKNPDCHSYYHELFKFKGIDPTKDETRDGAVALLQRLHKNHKASAASRLILDIAQGDTFRDAATPYLCSRLEKGIPSLFADVKTLYADDAKCTVVQDIVRTYKDSVAPDTGADPTAYLWSLYFLAQHSSYLGDQSAALALVDEAIAHTSTLPELYTLRARILRRAGDPVRAAIGAERARLLDGQDRFLNGKAAKYRFRANDQVGAETLLGLFTRKDALSPGADLEELQSVVYLLEAGGCLERSGKLGAALRKYRGVVQIFDDYEDDQYDFHGYILRRFTVNAYIGLLEYERELRKHPAYISAAVASARIYARLHDDPKLAADLLAPPKESEAEKKARKKAAKKAKQETPVKTPEKKDEKDKDDELIAPPAKDDNDPDGLKLLAAKDPLDVAAKLLRPLEVLVEREDVWSAVFDIAIRRRKYLQAVRALNHLSAVDKNSPALHERLVVFVHLVRDGKTELSPAQDAVVKSALEALVPGDIGAGALNSQYLQQHGEDPAAVLACARAAQRTGASVTEVEDAVFPIPQLEASVTIPVALDALSLLETIKSSREDEYREACQKRFEVATVFKTEKQRAEMLVQELEKLQQEMDDRGEEIVEQ